MCKYSTFDDICEQLCSVCCSPNGDCLPGGEECIHNSQFWELQELCKPVDELVNHLIDRVQHYSRDEEKRDSYLAYLNV